jgi:hypothetical protein
VVTTGEHTHCDRRKSLRLVLGMIHQAGGKGEEYSRKWKLFQEWDMGWGRMAIKV